MTQSIPKSKPHGLFRYIYDHYLVRCPNFHIAMRSVLTDEALDATKKIDHTNVASHLPDNSWLIAITRPDLHSLVIEQWDNMSPLARGNYLAGFTELAFAGGGQDVARISFITGELDNSESLEFTADTVCQMGCALLGSGLVEIFKEFLRSGIDLEQEIERNSPTNFRRWQAIDRLSKRLIDVFLEASLILKLPDATKLILGHGANPNTPVWKLERSSNALYPALSYAIKYNLPSAAEALLEYGADPRGLEYTSMRSPLAVAFQREDLQLVKQLLAAGASLEDGSRYSEAPMFYGIGSPVEWVEEHLAELLGLLPIQSKPLFHSPNAQGGHYYTLMECVWDDPEKLAFAEEIGMDLRLTIHEAARLIRSKRYATFCNLVGRLGEATMDEALSRVQQEWPEFTLEE